jgi:Helicase conserved C-terminal domain
MRDYKRSADKQRLFNDFNAGRIRILIGSSDTMGTGVNVQLRLKALHHLEVPWLPLQIEQREGRIERQSNQHVEIELYAYATLGSMDATKRQNNERKARFIAAALAGDRSIRTLEDPGSQANQFALANACAPAHLIVCLSGGEGRMAGHATACSTRSGTAIHAVLVLRRLLARDCGIPPSAPDSRPNRPWPGHTVCR